MPSGSGDRWAEDYERGRPGWPHAVVEITRLARSEAVLEVAAGTGKLTRLLVGTFDRVVAVEPAGAMRRILKSRCPQAEVLAGSAEEIPLAGASVDAVFAAEAFTHFDGKRAVAEMGRVLRPGGVLVLLWNLPAGPWEPSIAAVEELLDELIARLALKYAPLDLGPVAYTSGAWRDSFNSSPFEEPREATLANPQTLDREGLVAFLASMGWIGDLPDSERLPLLDKVRSLLGSDHYRRVWETRVHWTRMR
jgi:ubiquinone/menaquinone biosynthesis C-methylase UbiE